MEENTQTTMAKLEKKMPTVPTHGNWSEERGFGRQTSPTSDLKQYDLKLTDPPVSNNK